MIGLYFCFECTCTHGRIHRGYRTSGKSLVARNTGTDSLWSNCFSRAVRTHSPQKKIPNVVSIQPHEYVLDQPMKSWWKMITGNKLILTYLTNCSSRTFIIICNSFQKKEDIEQVGSLPESFYDKEK